MALFLRKNYCVYLLSCKKLIPLGNRTVDHLSNGIIRVNCVKSSSFIPFKQTTHFIL